MYLSSSSSRSALVKQPSLSGLTTWSSLDRPLLTHSTDGRVREPAWTPTKTQEALVTKRWSKGLVGLGLDRKRGRSPFRPVFVQPMQTLTEHRE